MWESLVKMQNKRFLLTIIIMLTSFSALVQVTDYHAHAITDFYRDLVAKHNYVIR